MYRTDKQGLIPALLSKWFNERVEMRKLVKKFHEQGDKKKEEYFDRRQYLQKILLNSLYGVLGLPVFRFYDIDNAEATTVTGQELIKFTQKMANYFYNKELSDNIKGEKSVDLLTSLLRKKYPRMKSSIINDYLKNVDVNAEIINPIKIKLLMLKLFNI